MANERTAVRAGNDLTEGPIVNKILLFALPVMASSLLQQLYNAVDSIVIGQYAGASSLAAVGVSNPVMMLFTALFMGISAGAGIVISQNFGAKNMERLRQAINTALSMAFIIGLLITVLGILLCRPLLRLLNVPDTVIGNAALYLTIIFAGTIGNVFFNYGSGILRGMGDSKWPLIALAISCFLNIVLDILFVYAFGWGIAGVAIATVIGQTLSGLALAWRINKFGYGIKISLYEMLHPNLDLAMTIIKLGVPSALQQVAMSLGGVITQSFTNRFGEVFIAANTVVQRVDGFVIMPMFGLSAAATTFAGQNMGAGKFERVKTGVSRILLMIVGLAVFMGVLMFFFGSYLAKAFTSQSDVIEIAVQGIRIICFVYAFMGMEITFAGALRGCGIAFMPMMASLGSLVARIVLVYVLAIVPFNYMGVYYAMGIQMIIGCLLNAVYYRFGNWRARSERVAARVNE